MESPNEQRQGRTPEPGPQPATGARSPAAGATTEDAWPGIALVAAWITGLVLSSGALFCRWWEIDHGGLPAWLAEGSRTAFVFLPLMALGPVFWWLHVRRSRARRPRRALSWWLGLESRPGQPGSRAGLLEWVLALGTGAASIAVSAAMAHVRVSGEGGPRFGALPPAYHDEYSYRFQAQTILAGRTWFPTHARAPQFFDQMHVLNDDGRYASRYFPGTGAWLAPFVALGRPYWGHWLAGGLVACFVFWSGRELAGNGTGLLAGVLTALAPGLAIFSNLLLAHHPTLVGLSGFLYAFLRMFRTGSPISAGCAGCGLAFAMLCRPMTAAGFGLPFGIWFAVWLLRPTAHPASGHPRRRLALLSAMSVPLVAALALLFAYNRSITGSGWTTPYAVYQDVYTPRQAYGFDNVERGLRHVGPKVRRAYDEWAENLTPALAVRNVGRRLLASWEWTLGVVPLAMAVAALPFCVRGAAPRGRFDLRWWLIPAAITSLHLAHVPYWFTGIMHWHYVFESGPLWLLLFAGVSTCLCSSWGRGGFAVPSWWAALVVLAVGSLWLPVQALDPFTDSRAPARSRVYAAIDEIAWSRIKYDRFRAEIHESVKPPAIIFVDPALEDAHIEYVTNTPDLSGPILYGRLLRREFERAAVLDAFTERAAYWVVADDALRMALLTGRFPHLRFGLVSELNLPEAHRVELWRVIPAAEGPRSSAKKSGPTSAM